MPSQHLWDNQRASIVGHDIGLMVAYAYAAQYPTEVWKKLEVRSFRSSLRSLTNELVMGNWR